VLRYTLFVTPDVTHIYLFIDCIDVIVLLYSDNIRIDRHPDLLVESFAFDHYSNNCYCTRRTKLLVNRRARLSVTYIVIWLQNLKLVNVCNNNNYNIYNIIYSFNFIFMYRYSYNMCYTYNTILKFCVITNYYYSIILYYVL